MLFANLRAPLHTCERGPQVRRKTKTTMEKSKKTKTKKCLKSKKNEIKHSPGEPKRLDFLRALLRASGVTLNELADHFNVSRVTVGNWFKVDDIRLSLAEEICEYCGYSLNLSLCRSPYEQDAPVHHLGRRAMQFERRHLPFLCVAMAREHVTSQEIANRLGLYYTTVHRWFDKNDMFLSRVEEVADVLDLSVRIDVTPLDTPRASGEHATRLEFHPLIFDKPLK